MWTWDGKFNQYWSAYIKRDNHIIFTLNRAYNIREDDAQMYVNRIIDLLNEEEERQRDNPI